MEKVINRKSGQKKLEADQTSDAVAERSSSLSIATRYQEVEEFLGTGSEGLPMAAERPPSPKSAGG
jgi:hypothetical protein